MKMICLLFPCSMASHLSIYDMVDFGGEPPKSQASHSDPLSFVYNWCLESYVMSRICIPLELVVI